MTDPNIVIAIEEVANCIRWHAFIFQILAVIMVLIGIMFSMKR